MSNAGYNPSDTNSSGQGVAAGTTSFATFASLPNAITYGNLTNLYTDYGSSFTETVGTHYQPGQTLNGVLTLTGLPDTVTTSVSSPGYGTENAPTKSYSYFGTTPLVSTETITTADSKLNSTTTYTRDNLGRVTDTLFSGYNSAGDPQSLGAAYFVSHNNTFDARFDLPTTSKNADPYNWTTTTAYDSFLGKPVSVTDANGATVTTTYDPLGRAILSQ